MQKQTQSRAAYYRTYRENNRERVAEKNKRWRDRNKDHIREYNRQYRQTHKEQVKQWNMNYWKRVMERQTEQAAQTGSD